MAVSPSPEEQEWIDHRVDSWVETYKKSMLTPVTLSLVAEHQPAEVSTIAEAVTAATGWQITERGLYRTVKRLQDSEPAAERRRRRPADRGETQTPVSDPAGGELSRRNQGQPRRGAGRLTILTRLTPPTDP